jgi:small-conductance mechanosensitive channel
LTLSASHSLGTNTAHILALIARWSIIVFVTFLVLHQLGVVQELLRILFAGVVAMIAIAGGLAFGLGGQGVARDLLESITQRFKK